jgi:hypothetical protein
VVEVYWDLLCSRGLDCLASSMSFVVMAKGKLFVELGNTGGGWLWRIDRIDNRMEAVLGYCLVEFFE